MDEAQGFSDKVDRIKGLLRPESDFDPGKEIAGRYPDPALLIPAQIAEIEAAYEAALETPIGLLPRPHLSLALTLYRLGFNPRSIYNAVALAEWVLAHYWQAHPQQTTIPPSSQNDLARAA